MRSTAVALVTTTTAWAWAWTLGSAASPPPLFLLKYSTDSLRDELAEPQRLSPVRTAADAAAYYGRVRLMIAASLGSLSTTATAISSQVSVTTCDDTTSALFLTDASVVEVERVLESLWLSPPPPPLSDSRCGDRAFRSPRVDIWIQSADSMSPTVTCTDLPRISDQLGLAGETDHHVKRITLLAPPPSLLTSMDTLQIRASEEIRLSGLTLRVPQEATFCGDVDRRQRFRLRVSTASEVDGKLALRPSIQSFLSAYLSPPDSGNQSRVIQLEAASDYIRLALRSLTYTAPSRNRSDAIHVDLWTIGADTNEQLVHSVHIAVTVAREAVPVHVLWNKASINMSLVVDMDEDSTLSLSGLSIGLPTDEVYGGLVLNATLAVAHGMFKARHDDPERAAASLAIRRETDASVIQISGQLSDLNRFVQQLVFQPKPNYNGPESIVISIIQNVLSAQDPNTDTVQPTSELLRVFLQPVEDGFSIEWADSHANTSSVTIPYSTRRRLPPVLITDGEEEGGDSTPFFTYQGFLRAEVETSARSCVRLKHDAVPSTHIVRDGRDVVRLMFEGTASGLTAILASVEIVPVRSIFAHCTASSVVVRLARVNATGGSSSPGIEVEIAVTLVRDSVSSLPQLFSQQHVHAQEDELADLGRVFAWENVLPEGEEGDAVAGAVVGMAVTHGHVASNASVETSVPQRNLTFQATSVVHLKSVLSQLTYIPDRNYAGDDKLVLSVHDETALLWIRVLPVNDPPTLVLEGPINSTKLFPLRTFVPRIKVDDPDIDDWLTLELMIAPHYRLMFIDPMDAFASGLQIHGMESDPLWVVGSPFATDTLRVRGTSTALNEVFFDSSVVEILAPDDSKRRVKAVDVRICVSDDALLSDCVTQSIHLPVFDSLIQFPSAKMPALAFRRPIPASAFVSTNETAMLQNEAIVSMRLSAQFGSFMTMESADDSPRCGVSTERQYDYGGAMQLVIELTGSWGCIHGLIQYSVYQGPHIISAKPTIENVSIELWHTTRRLAARSFALPLLLPVPRFQVSATSRSSETGTISTEPPVWRWVRGRRAVLNQFVEIYINHVALEEADVDDDGEYAEDRLLAFNVSCSKSCLLTYSLDNNEAVVPGVDYSFASRQPSHVLQFFGTRQSLTRLFSTLKIGASVTSVGAGDGHVDIAVAEADNFPYESAVASARVAFRFEISAPPLEWLATQRTFINGVGSDIVWVDGVRLTGGDGDPLQRVHVVVECEGGMALSVTIDHPAARIVDRPCGLAADHESIEIVESLATVNNILRNIQIHRRFSQGPLQDEGVTMVRLVATRGGNTMVSTIEVQVQFRPALASETTLAQLIVAVANTTRAVDEDSSVRLGDVFFVQDYDKDQLYHMSATVSHGVLSVPLDEVCCIHIISPASARSLIVEGGLSALREVIAAAYYEPLAEYSGVDSLRLIIRDAKPDAAKWTSEMLIHVRPVNDAPRLVVHQARTQEVNDWPSSSNATLLQTAVSIQVIDVDLTPLLARTDNSLAENSTSDPSIVRVRLRVGSPTTFIIVPRWDSLNESLTTASYVPAPYTQGTPNASGLPMRSLTLDAPIDTANTLLSSVLFLSLTGGTDDAEDDLLEVYVNDLGHGMGGWEPAEVTESIRVHSGREAGYEAPVGLALPLHHASLAPNDRKLMITGLSLTMSSAVADEGELDLDRQDDDTLVRVTGTAAFRVVPEVQRIQLVGPEQVQILTVMIQTPGGVEAASVGGTFVLQVTDAVANQVRTVSVYAQAVAMRVDEVMGSEGTGRGRDESMEASFVNILPTSTNSNKIHVVKTVAASVVTWQISSMIAPAGSSLPVPQVATTAFSGTATATTKSNVQAASLSGLFVLQFGDEITRSIDAGASALEIQDALEELVGIHVVQVRSVGAFTWDVTFFRPGANVPMLDGDGSLLTPVVTISDAAWPMMTSNGAAVEITRVTEGVGQGSVYEIDIGGTHVGPVYSVAVTRAVTTLGGSSFALGFRSDATGAQLATTDAIAFDAVAMASDEGVLMQEGGRLGSSVESKLRQAIQSLPQRHWFSATRVVVSRITTASPPATTWTITFVDAPSDFPALVSVASSAQPPIARLTVVVSLVSPSNAVGGTFTLSVRDETTTPLPVSSTARTIQDRLIALDAVRNASCLVGQVLVRRKEIQSVGGVSFALLFVEQMAAAATSVVNADGGALTGLGAFARVRQFQASAWKDGSWAFPALSTLSASVSAWTRGIEVSLEPDTFTLRGAAADMRMCLQQFTYTLPSDWCCGFVSVVIRAERMGASTHRTVVLKTEEQHLPFQVPTAGVIVSAVADEDGDAHDVAVTRGQQHAISFLRLEVPLRVRGLLWLCVHARVVYGTLALNTRVGTVATPAIDLWLNGTAERITRLLMQLQYASPTSREHAMDVLSIDVRSHADLKLLTQSEYLVRVEELPFEPRVSFSPSLSQDGAVAVSDDAPRALRGITIVDANTHAAPLGIGVDLRVEAALGRVYFIHIDGVANATVSAEDPTGVMLRGSVPTLNSALDSLYYESSRVFTHTRDTITIRTMYNAARRPLLTHSRSLQVEIHHAVHVPRVCLGSCTTGAVAFAAKEDTGYRFPNIALVASATRLPRARPGGATHTVVTELRRTELQPLQVTTRTNDSPDDDPRHQWVVDLPALSSSATSAWPFASFPTATGGGSSRFFFAGTDRTHGEELWTSDGSSNGTQLFADLAPGNSSSTPSDFAVLPSTASTTGMVFAADGIDRSWTLDTATACNRERTSSTAADLLYVVAASATWDPTASYECPRNGWRWATTQDANARFSLESGATNLSEPYVFWGTCDWVGFVFGGVTRKHFRFADSAVTGALKHAGRRDSAPVEVSFATTDFAGIVCIRDDHGRSAAGRELWITDGVASTKRLKDLEPGPRSSNPKFLTPFQSRWVLFQATTASLGAELFKTDGTTGGTVLVEDIWRGPRSSSPSDLVEWTNSGGGDGRLYFAATTETGRELWSTDGLSSETVERGRRRASSPAVLIGTTMVRDICPSAASSDPQFLTPFGSLGVFFSATDCVNGRELWATDGSRTGTRMIVDINPESGRGSDPSHLVAFNGNLYFAATLGASTGRELFVSDGTAAGTRLLLELAPGVASAAPSLLTVANARLYFHALDAHGVGSLWASDGTAAGTTPVWDVPFAQLHSVPFLPEQTCSGRNARLFVFNSALYYFTQRRLTTLSETHANDGDGDGDGDGDTFQLQMTVDHGSISIPPERPRPSPSHVVNGTRRRLEDVLRRTLFHPPLNWNVLQTPQDHVVQWNFSVASLASPATETTLADLIVRPQLDAPVIVVPNAVEHATQSERDYLSRLRLECLPITVLEDVATPLRGFSARGVDDLDAMDTWELELSVSRGRLDLPVDASGCVGTITMGRLTNTNHVRLTTARGVACVSRLLRGLTYTSEPHVSGSDSLKIRVAAVMIGSQLTAEDVVVVPIVVTEINDAPFLTSPTRLFFYEADEDRALVIQDLRVEDADALPTQRVRLDLQARFGSIALLAHGADVAKSSLVVLQNASATWAPAASTRLVISGSLGDINAVLASGILYTSAPDWNSLAHANESDGYDTLSIDLSDGQAFNASTQATLYVFVTPTPDPVIITPPTMLATSVYAALGDGGTLHGDEDTWLETTGLAFASHDDTARTSLDVTLRVTQGRLAMDETVLRSHGVSTSGSADDGSVWRLRGRFAHVTRSVSRLRYLPPPDFYGADALEVVATATDDYAPQQSIQTTAVVAIHVHAVNDPPQWTLPAPRLHWRQDGSTRILGVQLQDADAASIDCATLAGGCTWDVVLEATRSGLLTLPRLSEVPTVSTASATTNYIVLSGSLAQLNRALGEIVLTTNNTDRVVREPVDVWFTADDRGTFGSGGPHITRQRIVVTPLQRTRHRVELIAPQDNVLSVDEDTELVFSDGSIRLHDRDATTRSVVAAPLYEVAIESIHGQFRLAVASVGVTRLLPIPSASDRVLRFRGFAPEINAALNGSAYVPDRDWFGADQLRITVTQVDEENVEDADIDSATATLFVFVSPVCDAPRWRLRDDHDLQADVVLDEDTQVLVTSLAIVDPDIFAKDGSSSDSHRHLSVAIRVHDNGGVMLATTRGLRLTDASSPQADGWKPSFASLRLLLLSRAVLTGCVDDLNSALRGLIYHPQPDFHTSGHVRDAITLRTFSSDATCGVASDSERTLRVQIFAVNDPPRVDSPQFQQVTKRDLASLVGIEPTLEALAGQDSTLDAITLTDVDTNVVEGLVSGQPTMRLRVSCCSCRVRPTMTLETLQQTHGVVASQDTTSADGDWGPATVYYGTIPTLNAVVLSSLIFTSEPYVARNDTAVVLLEVSDLGFSGRGPPHDMVFAMTVRVLRVNRGPQILVPPFGTEAPRLQVEEHGSVLLQGAPPLPLPVRLSAATDTPTWQLLFTDPHGVDSRSRVRSLLDVVSLDGRSAIASYALLSSTQLVFSSTTAATGTELWTSDGTASGTKLLKDLLPGPRGSAPASLSRFSVDNRVYFSARAPNADDWRLRPALRDACDGLRESAFAPGVVFVVAQQTAWVVDDTYDCPIGYRWMTTAEAATVFLGTQPRDGHTDEPLVYFDQCGWRGFDWGGTTRRHFRFADSRRTGAFKDAGHRDSYRPDVGFQTQQFAGIVCRRLSLENEENDVVGEFLWSTDGTTEGTRRVTSIATRPKFLTEFRGRLFFQATTDAYGSELWASDGIATQLIADIAPGPRSATPEQLTVASNKLFFSATTDSYGRELWVSDGDVRTEFAQVDHAAPSATATRLVLDIRSGPTSSQPLFLTALPAAGLVLFQADDGIHGPELWKSDGSASGTGLVLDICAGARGSTPRFLTLFNGCVFFQADDGVRGAELWVSDGSGANTQLLVDLVAGARGATPRYLSVLTLPSVASVLVFAAAGDRDPQAVEFFTSDGTSGGTQKLFPASHEPVGLNDAALDALHDGRARLLPMAGGFVVLGRRRQQRPPSSLTLTPSTESRSLTLVDDDEGADPRIYSVTLRTEHGVLLLPHRLACGGEEPAAPTNTIALRGSLPTLNCLVAQVVYEATSPATGSRDDAIVVTLTEEDAMRDDGRAYAATQRVPVRVTASNHAPVLTDMPARVDAPLDVWTPLPTIRVSDEDAGDAAMLLLRVAVQRGRVRLVDAHVDASGLTLLSAVDPRGRAALEVAGSLTALNAALRQRVQYACLTVDDCVAGDRDTVVVTVDDNGFSGSGGAQSTTQTAPIAVVG